jgi:hypothetical protein
MKLQSRKQNTLAEMFRSQQEEINKYKWIESEKAGRDIGWEQAAHEWMRQHFPGWKRSSWNQLVREALRAEQGRN